MPGTNRAGSVVVRWLLVALQLAGIGCAGWAALELLDPESRGSHVTGVARWPAFALVSGAAAVAFAGLCVDIARPIMVRGYSRVLRDTFIVIVAAIAAQVLFSTNFKPFLCAFTLGVGGGVLAALRWLDRIAAAVRDRRALRLLELVAFQTCLVFVGMEMLLRLVSAVVPMPILMRDESSMQAAMATYQYPPGTIRDGFPMNSMGHYDEEFAPGERTVVSIGDSFSIGIVPQFFHFTTACERELAGVEVHNLGRAGIGPAGYLWFLEHHGLALNPDLILINLFAGNDVEESKRWNNTRSWIRSVCDRRNVLTYQVPKRLWRLLHEAGVEPTNGSGRLATGDSRSIRDPQELRAKMLWLDDPSLERPTLSADAFARIEAERASAIRDAPTHGTYKKLFDVLEAIHDAAGDVPLVVMLIPDQFQVDEEVWRTVTSQAGAELARGQPQARIAAWLKTRGIPYLDLLPVLRGVPRMADGRRHLYHLRDTHFNARGNRVTGAALAKFLRAELGR